MARKIYTPEQMIGMLREAEVRLSQGDKIGSICRSVGISEQSYYRWRREYGGLKVNQAKRLKDLEKENQRLRKAVSDLTLDALILGRLLRESTEPPATSAGHQSCAGSDCGIGTPCLSGRWLAPLDPAETSPARHR